MRRASIAFAALAALIASAAATAAGSPQKDFSRIISFSPAVTEIIYSLGASDRLVGIASFSDYPPEASKEKPAVGGILNIDTEKVLSLRPDLLISPPGAIASEKLPTFGADVSFLPDKTLADVQSSFIEIGRLVGKPAEGRALAARLAAAIAAAKARNSAAPVSVNSSASAPKLAEGEVSPVQPNGERGGPPAYSPKTLLVIGYEPLWVAGGYGFLDELLTAAGATNVARVEKDFYAIDIESVLATRPDCIIDVALEDSRDPARRAATLAFWKRYPSIPAVASGRIVFIDSDLLTIPGPRLVDGLAALESALRPSPSATSPAAPNAPAPGPASPNPAIPPREPASPDSAPAHESSPASSPASAPPAGAAP